MRLKTTLVATMALPLLAGCGYGDTDKRVLLTLGAEAPPIEVETLSGDTWQLSESIAKGNAAAVFFLASWCPCTKESLVFIKDAHAKYSAKGIDFIALGIQDKEPKFRKFMQAEVSETPAEPQRAEVSETPAKPLPFPTAFDHGDKVARSYGIKAPPSVVFIARDGTVRRAHYGNIKDVKDAFDSWFVELLSEELVSPVSPLPGEAQ